MIDVLYLWSIGFTRAHLRAWAASLFPMAAAFMAIELLWAVYAFATLPAALALDVLWPLYILESYEVWSTAAGRWLWWGGWRLMIGQYLLPLSAGVLGLSALRRWSAGARRSGSPRSRTISVGGLRRGVHSALLLHHRLLLPVSNGCIDFRQFLWALVPAAAWELQRRGAAVRTAVACIWAPGFAVMIRASVVPAAGFAPRQRQPADRWNDSYVCAMAERIRFLERFTAQDAKARRSCSFNAASAAARAGITPTRSHTRPATRGSLRRISIRPYEEAAFIDALSRTVALIECDESDGGDHHRAARWICRFHPRSLRPSAAG